MSKQYYFLGLSTLVLTSLLTFRYERFHPASGDRTLAIGDPFPAVTGTLLNRQEVTVPEYLDGKVAVLIPVFKRQSQSTVDSWTTELFPQLPGHPDLRVLEMPMIQNWQWAAGYVDGIMRSAISEDLHLNVLTYYGQMRDYYDRFGTREKSEVHVYVLDRAGKVQFIEGGQATAGKIAALWEVVERELAGK